METAEQIFKQIKVEGLRLLTEWKDNFKTENLYLEFKRKAKADRSGLDKEDRLNLGKTISSFSNSEGGVVIWGIDCGKSNEEQLDSIQQLVPINDYNKFCAHLEGSYSQLVSPLKKAVEFHSFPYDQNSGFVAQLVHKSDLEPIMCTVSKIQGYYTRVSGQDLLMEHYQIVDAFSRKGKPNLKLSLKVQRTRSDNHGTRHIRIILYLKNTGMHIAFYPFLIINRISNHELEEISTQRGINKYSPFPYFLVQGNQYLFKSYQNIVVHPDLSELVCHFDVVASTKNYSEFEMDVSFGSQDFILTKKKIHINAMEMQNLFESLYGNGNKVLDLDEKFILDVE